MTTVAHGTRARLASRWMVRASRYSGSAWTRTHDAFGHTLIAVRKPLRRPLRRKLCRLSPRVRARKASGSSTNGVDSEAITVPVSVCT